MKVHAIVAYDMRSADDAARVPPFQQGEVQGFIRDVIAPNLLVCDPADAESLAREGCAKAIATFGDTSASKSIGSVFIAVFPTLREALEAGVRFWQIAAVEDTDDYLIPVLMTPLVYQEIQPFLPVEKMTELMLSDESDEPVDFPVPAVSQEAVIGRKITGVGAVSSTLSFRISQRGDRDIAKAPSAIVEPPIDMRGLFLIDAATQTRVVLAHVVSYAAHRGTRALVVNLSDGSHIPARFTSEDERNKAIAALDQAISDFYKE